MGRRPIVPRSSINSHSFFSFTFSPGWLSCLSNLLSLSTDGLKFLNKPAAPSALLFGSHVEKLAPKLVLGAHLSLVVLMGSCHIWKYIMIDGIPIRPDSRVLLVLLVPSNQWEKSSFMNQLIRVLCIILRTQSA